MNRNTGLNAGQIIGTMNGQQVVGLDIAKQVFQMHTVNMGTGEIVNVQIKRPKVLEHFANLTPCLVAIEACGGAHYWAHAKEPGPWLQQIKDRRPFNVLFVAQAAKMARTIWAVTAKEQDYQSDFNSVRPQAA